MQYWGFQSSTRKEHKMLLAENPSNAKESTRKNSSQKTPVPAMSSDLYPCPAMSGYVKVYANLAQQEHLGRAPDVSG